MTAGEAACGETETVEEFVDVKLAPRLRLARVVALAKRFPPENDLRLNIRSSVVDRRFGGPYSRLLLCQASSESAVSSAELLWAEATGL